MVTNNESTNVNIHIGEYIVIIVKISIARIFSNTISYHIDLGMLCYDIDRQFIL